MDVPVRLSAGLASAAGRSHLTVTLVDGASVADLLAHLRTEYPALVSKLDQAVPVISGRHATLSTPLSGRQEVALLLPIAGGVS